MSNHRIDALTPGTFTLDDQDIEFGPGDTIMQAVTRAGGYIPHLCWHEGFQPHGSCRLCTVKVNGRMGSACTVLASTGQNVESNTEELRTQRRTLLQMMFVEGNHFCPSCEKSGQCRLQATAYEAGMTGPHFEEFYPNRKVDASHPDMLLDLNRCILCELCVRASRDLDGKDVFAVGGHGIGAHLLINSPSGLLGDSALAVDDKAAHVCPVGALLPKRRGFVTPIGARRFDIHPVSTSEGVAP
jgi:[NiFe] hydrogenase diaphorase moiety small subunit